MDKKEATEQVGQGLVPTLQSWLANPEIILGRLLLIVLVLVVAFVAYWLVRRVLRRVQEQLTIRTAEGAAAARRTARSLTVLSLLASIAKWIIFLSALLWVLALAGMNLLPVLTGAGIAGLAIGLGAQSLIRDFFSGLFMMLEGQFAVGDHVTINGIFGVVEELGLRVTVLADPTGKRHYLPNGAITTVTVYEEPRQSYRVQMELVQGRQAEAGAAVLAGVLGELQAAFPRQLVSYEAPRAQGREDGTGWLAGTLQVFPDQVWVAQEELPARLLRALRAAEIEVAEEVKPRVHAQQSDLLA